MDRTVFITVTAITLFTAFLLGWLINALVMRFRRIAPQSMDELERLAQRLHETEEARDAAIMTLEKREAEMTERMARTGTQLRSALDELRESRAEIEELRAYIDRKLGRG